MGNTGNTGNFGEHTTTDEVLDGIDLSGKRYLVTGASAGLGVETTRALAAHGGAVLMAVRDMDKGAAARDEVLAQVPGADLELRQLDLASFDSIRGFGEGFMANNDTLDCFIGNAGIMACPQGETADGWELQFGTNHLGHFLLFNLIAPALVAAGNSRVVLLSSSGHRFSDVDLDDPNFERTEYDPWISYGRAKTANALMAVGVDDRFKDQGIRANALHPGAIHTELSRHLTEDSMMQLITRVKAAEDQRGGRQLFKKVPAGAATTVYAACHPDMDGVGAQFLEDCAIAEPTTDPVRMSGVRTYALDHDTADRLWDKSLEWVGLA
jgi:NAD(P)-dependent dehydrogenase (short-subunit alcohol dehydrogenase family)